MVALYTKQDFCMKNILRKDDSVFLKEGTVQVIGPFVNFTSCKNIDVDFKTKASYKILWLTAVYTYIAVALGILDGISRIKSFLLPFLTGV